MQSSIEYQLAKGYLNKLYELNLITYEEKEDIDNQIKLRYRQTEKQSA